MLISSLIITLTSINYFYKIEGELDKLQSYFKIIILYNLILIFSNL